jgi:hypothetical protein
MALQQDKQAAAEEQEPAPAPAEAEAAETTPEQALADKLELDRFVEKLRRKFH